MNTEITLKGIQLTRSGYSKRGFTSTGIILAAYNNSSNKTESRTKALRAMSKIRVLFSLSHDELIFIAQKLKEIAEDNHQH
ncbi:hypothetical protein J9K13_000440 [Salmonella enterica]|nr:hypothetical protein [Salmonella enterica]EHK2733001.1 hypothetical protein [Salmonella enterica]HEC8454190.1 hypothetical protein [Salmonella enterica subsp. enterica serovar Poona]